MSPRKDLVPLFFEVATFIIFLFFYCVKIHLTKSTILMIFEVYSSVAWNIFALLCSLLTVHPITLSILWIWTPVPVKHRLPILPSSPPLARNRCGDLLLFYLPVSHWSLLRLQWADDFKTIITFLFLIIVDPQWSCRSNTERSHVSSAHCSSC